MGGGKKPSLAQIERSQKKEEEKKPKKRQEEQRQKVAPLPKSVDPSDLMDKIKSLGAITPQSVVSVTPMTVGDAKRLLRRMENEGLLTKISSFNGQPIYSLKTTNPEPSPGANVTQ